MVDAISLLYLTSIIFIEGTLNTEGVSILSIFSLRLCGSFFYVLKILRIFLTPITQGDMI